MHAPHFHSRIRTRKELLANIAQNMKKNAKKKEINKS